MINFLQRFAPFAPVAKQDPVKHLIPAGFVVKTKVSGTLTARIHCEDRESFDNLMKAFPESEYMEVFTIA